MTLLREPGSEGSSFFDTGAAAALVGVESVMLCKVELCGIELALSGVVLLHERGDVPLRSDEALPEALPTGETLVGAADEAVVVCRVAGCGLSGTARVGLLAPIFTLAREPGTSGSCCGSGAEEATGVGADISMPPLRGVR